MSRGAKLLATLCALVLGGCLLRGGWPQRIETVRPAGAGGGSHAVAAPAVAPTPTVSLSPVASDDPYESMARTLHQLGVQVWFETDLVAAWREGPTAFDQVLQRLGTLASVPGVRGFKVADELGYNDGLTSGAEATAFLRDADAGLARVAPHAQLLIDVVVPELGCLAWTSKGSQSCADEQRAKHPAASEAAVSAYLRAGLVDRLDLSTSLLDEWTYRGWHLGQAQAQAEAWKHVRSLGWQHETVLQARKALADVGGYQGSTIQASHDVRTFVSVPVSGGAQAVDVWTWRQPYDGHTVSLLDDRLEPNPLWRSLDVQRRAGVHLFTHITPSMLLPTKAQQTREYARVAEMFDAVFVAAGTG